MAFKRKGKFSARQRMQDQEERKGGFKVTAIDIPENMRFKVTEARVHYLDILPFVAGKFNPFFEEGEEAMDRTYWYHAGIAADDRDYFICPYNQTKHLDTPSRCPVCEKLRELRKDPDVPDEFTKQFAAKQRQLYLVREIDQDNPTKPFSLDDLKVWDISFHLFGKVLADHIRDLDEDEEEFQYFADPEEGFTLKIGFSEKTFASNKFFETSSIGFKKRKLQYKDLDLATLPSLDKFVITKSYEELEAIMAGGKLGSGAVSSQDVDDEYVDEGEQQDAEEREEPQQEVEEEPVKEPAKKTKSSKPSSKSKKEQPEVVAAAASESSEGDDWEDWD